MNTALMTISKGQRVTVYHDPITRTSKEGPAMVCRVGPKLDYTDARGYALYRCDVKFHGDNRAYTRDISV